MQQRIEPRLTKFTLQQSLGISGLGLLTYLKYALKKRPAGLLLVRAATRSFKIGEIGI